VRSLLGCSSAWGVRTVGNSSGVSSWWQRTAVPIGLLLAGAASAFLVFTTGDPTWKAVWIGLASTCLTAGLVDGSALLDARGRKRAVLRVVGHRIGFVHQRYLWIVRAAFDLSWNDAANVPDALRAFEPNTGRRPADRNAANDAADHALGLQRRLPRRAERCAWGRR
jgi:hypothetical protein